MNYIKVRYCIHRKPQPVCLPYPLFLTHIIHKIIDRYSIRAALNSFGERIFLGGSTSVEPRMSDNTISVSMHKIYELNELSHFFIESQLLFDSEGLIFTSM